MSLTLRAVPTVVCACFYSLLETCGMERDASVAWQTWMTTVARQPGALYEEPAAAQMREDLTRLGREAFVAEWSYLLGVMDAGNPGELHQVLRNIFAPVVEAGFALRARQRGQA